MSRIRKTLVVISGAARGNEVTPLHQSETVSVGGIREWQYAGKRGRYPYKESGRRSVTTVRKKELPGT
ncbi:MAG: hypothetical protein ACXW01_09315 [Methylobacter sp.]